MRPGKASLVFALGFFALAAQTLLFRDFLTTFEGNEIALGAFFASWFFWVAAGALAARLTGRKSLPIAPLALLYLPAYVLEHYLILHLRSLAGIPAYEMFPLTQMLVLSVLTNAPVSLLTGFMFPMACAWVREDSPAGVSAGRVYATETLGAACGGVMVTIAPFFAYGAGVQFLLASLPLTLAAAWVFQGNTLRPLDRRRWRRHVCFLVPVLVLLALAAGLGERWSTFDARGTWARLMPVEAYQGRFLTAHGEYLYGEREGQFVVVTSGTPCESLPGEADAAETAALCLAQQPETKRVLIIGANGLALGRQFLKLSQVDRLVWVHPDPEYATELIAVLPESFTSAPARIEISGMDPRTFVRSEPQAFDLIVLNLSGAATLASNRYYTSAFFEEIKRSLAQRGVTALRFQGPANVIGQEHALLGASVVMAFESAFSHTALKPGESSWIMGSVEGELSESPAILREQFASVQGSSLIAPADALWTLYPPDRIAAQRDAYARIAESLPAVLLQNTDTQPRALLHTLLVMLRQSGIAGTVLFAQFASSVGVWMLLSGIVLYTALRWLYVRRLQRTTTVYSFFDSGVLIFSTGLAGMAACMLLLFAYQTIHGALYLQIGLLSAIFMLGAFAGSACMQRAMHQRTQEPTPLLPLILISHAFFIGFASWRSAAASSTEFAILFLFAGAFTGLYFPLAAHRAREHSDRDTATAFEALDHVGAALGAASTGILLLPLAGTAATSCILAVLLGVNLPALLHARLPAHETDLFDQWRRPVGYTVFGICVMLVAGSTLAAITVPDTMSQEFRNTARKMSGGADLSAESLPLARSPSASFYTFTQDEAARHIFNSFDLAPEVTGFGGPIAVAFTTDDDGTLSDVAIIRSRETPAYVNMVLPWLNGLEGRNLFADSPFDGVDAVSGATVTSRALLRILEQSGHVLVATKPGAVATERVYYRDGTVPDFDFLLLAVFVGGAVLMRFRPGRWRRRAFLLAALLVLGVWRNLQYSAHHALSLPDPLSLAPHWTAAFFLVVLVPLITLLVGNVYCGYVCPFGALQELLGDLRPARLAADPEKRTWRYGRMVKYVLFAVIALRFAFTRDPAFLSADPLTTIFSVARERETVVLAAVLLALSIPFRRFWCRNLCPAGAFLALLNHVRLLRPLSPPVQPRHCDLGVRTAGDFDCLRCDRCAHAKE